MFNKIYNEVVVEFSLFWMIIADDNEGDGDSDSFHASIWDEERLRRQQIHFNFSDDPEEEVVLHLHLLKNTKSKPRKAFLYRHLTHFAEIEYMGLTIPITTRAVNHAVTILLKRWGWGERRNKI